MSREAKDYIVTFSWGAVAIHPANGKGMGVSLGDLKDGLLTMKDMAAKYTRFDSGSLRALADFMDKVEDEKGDAR